ncbi:MAG: ABC transporter ATP-binding protein [Desulfarculaceae bacterium]
MSAPAIQVEHLAKRYRLGKSLEKPSSFMGAVGRALKAPFKYLIRATTKASEDELIWAVKDVSFQVQPGEVVGIIGHNGAGKTTVLKILSRITDPTQGSALVRGRVGTLLQVGTGFHPELTGRENIYLNGAIMGMRKQEIDTRFEEMVEFAEVAKFIDTPVKYYSSGMYVRLAFSVAAHLEPEILLVDEVLAVGDLAFQKKCLGKMGSVAGEGRTVLLVSHNMEAILGLCPRTIWLDHGLVAADGASKEVVNRYTQASLALSSHDNFAEKQRMGDGLVEFTGIALRDSQGRTVDFATCGEPVEFVIDYRTNGQELKNVSSWLWIRDQMGMRIMCLWTKLTNQDFERLPPQGQLVCRVPRLSLAPGSYRLDLAALTPGHRTDKVLRAGLLEVAPGDFYGTGRPITNVGLALSDYSWGLEA